MSRQSADSLGVRNRIPLVVRRFSSSTTDWSCSKLEVATSACTGFPDRERDDRSI